MARIKDPTDYDKAKLQPDPATAPRKKRTKPGQSVGGDLGLIQNSRGKKK